jgi:hypothetical protein
MFDYFTSFFTTTNNNYNIEVAAPLLVSISSQNEFSKVKDLFEKCVEDLPLDGSAESDLKTIFFTFDNIQINNFSNNIIEYIKFQIAEKIKLLNQSVQLMLHFIYCVFQRLNSAKELIDLSYNQIIDENKDAKEIINSTFPYNLFIFCVDILNNEDFLSQKEYFKNDVDKFNFVYKLTSVIFYFIHHRDHPIEKNMSSSIENLDTLKLFIFNGKEIFISIQKQKNFFFRLFNTSMNNFDIILTNRIDSRISQDTFETFLFMNVYIFLFLCCDNNRFLLKEIIETNKTPIQFNSKSLIVGKKLLNIENDEDLLKISTDYFEEYNSLLKTNLLQSANNFRKLISNFYNNLETLTVYFQIMMKCIILYSFTVYPDICEMISLNSEIINLIMDKISYDNTFDLMIMFLFSKSKNFYISMKHLNISTEALCLNSLNNIINQRLNNKKNFTYSILFSLLTSKSLAENIHEVTDNCYIYLENYINYFNACEITIDNIYETMACLKPFYDIILNIVRNLDSPSRFIYQIILYFDKCKLCHEKLVTFVSNNIKTEVKKKTYEDYKTSYEKFETFVNDTLLKISKEGLGVKYSNIEDVISIINKISFKDNNQNEEKPNYFIFGGDAERFIITSLHSFDKYKIIFK